MWEVACGSRNKKFKLFLSGPPGGLKTRVALMLSDNKNREEPAVGVIDTEFGTDHYRDQFAFRLKQENDPKVIYSEVRKLVKNPGNIRTLIFDTFSVYYDALMELWVDRFQKRELTSAGNKGEYYTLQPRDYVHINRSAGKLVRMLLKCDLNIICICQNKEEWKDMKVVGSVFDGWKRLPYYFDTVIKIEKGEKPDTWKAFVNGKDRSYSFKPGQNIPWENDKQIYDYMVSKMGQDLSGGDKAVSYDPDSKNITESTTIAESKTDGSKKDTSHAQATEKKDKKTDSASATDKQLDQDQAIESTEVEEDTSGPVDRPKLMEIVKEKKTAKINDPVVWAKLLSNYEVSTAKDLTMNQANELFKGSYSWRTPYIKQYRFSRLWECVFLYGEDAVKQAGIALFGYPGTWITKVSEVKKLKTFLAEKY